MLDRKETLVRIRELGLLAVVRGDSRKGALEVTEALIEGGVFGIEITFTTPEAHLVMKDLNKEYGDRILLGAGTVTDPRQVESSVAAGANFLVSPGCDPNLLFFMLETGLTVMPGVLTPSEVMIARRLGVEALKLFPGSSGGPSYLKTLRGPFPDVAFMPTGGVSLENIAEWFAAGAFAVGAGSALAPPSLEGRDYRELVTLAHKFAETARIAADHTW